MRTACIIQARLGSTRLPGKILAEVRPGSTAAARWPVTMLAEVVSRVRQMKTVDLIVVAFPSHADASDTVSATAFDADDAAALDADDDCTQTYAPPDSVSESDVLSRYVGAGRAFDADVIVRVTADCPLFDPVLGDETVRLGGDWSEKDYVCNFHMGAGPRLRGFAVEAFPRDMLEWAHRHASPVPCPEREHVTPLIRQHALMHGNYAVHLWEASLECPSGLPNLSVDTAEDLERVRRVLAAGKGGSWRDVVDMVRGT